MWYLSNLALVQALGRRQLEASGGVRRLNRRQQQTVRPASGGVALRPAVVR